MSQSQYTDIEHLKNWYKNEGKKDPLIAQIISDRTSWLNAQRYDFLTDVNVGNWSDLNTRAMANQANCVELYNFAYVPFSGVTHNMWQHINRYNLDICQNPLHKYCVNGYF